MGSVLVGVSDIYRTKLGKNLIHFTMMKYTRFFRRIANRDWTSGLKRASLKRKATVSTDVSTSFSAGNSRSYRSLPLKRRTLQFDSLLKMKLTPELIAQSPSYLNAVKERQLDLRGKLSLIFNLS